jgi:plastocyanin
VERKVLALTVAVFISFGLLYAHPAYAHNFASDESANFLGKVANLKAEVQALKMDLSDPNAVAWHVNQIQQYWTDYDTSQMQERNQLLSTEIPDTINKIITMAQQPSPDTSSISTQIDTLNGYLDEGVTARIDQDKLQNATVQGLADTDIIKDTLADYGTAINSQYDLNDMSKWQGMSMNTGSSSGSMNMSSGQMQSSGGSSSAQTVMISSGAGANQDCVASKNCFNPQTLNVSPGTTVTWKNMDTVSHTVTSGNPSDNQTGTIFDSSLIKPGDTFSFTFKDAGTYNYFCMVHPWMTGQVVVGQGGSMSGMNMGTSYAEKTPSIHLVQMSGMQSSGGSMSGMQSSTGSTVTIANMAAYHSAQTHAQAAKDYLEKNVVPLASSSVTTLVTKADNNLSNLIDAINNKSDGQTVMGIVHGNIHPALIAAFNLPQMTMSTANAVPEFPVPAILVVVSIVGVVAITRFIPKLH